MGSAIATALAKKGQKVFVYDKNFAKVRALAKGTKIFGVSDLGNLGSADYVILAVKPYHLTELADAVSGRIKSSAVLISIAAGVTIKKLEKLFGHKKIIRMMPNLGLSVGQGIAGWMSFGLTNIEKQRTKKLIGLFTENFEVKKENEINSITAISGSGPAYFFYLADALQKSAIVLGFDAKTSRKLVEKTFSAAATLQKNGTYDELIKQVASKKGTTEAALKVFKKYALDKIIDKAAQAAKKRAQEISRQ